MHGAFFYDAHLSQVRYTVAKQEQEYYAMAKRGWSIDSLAIIFSIIVIAQLLTYAVPQGEFERQAYAGDASRQMVVANTFDYADAGEQVSLKPWHWARFPTAPGCDSSDRCCSSFSRWQSCS